MDKGITIRLSALQTKNEKYFHLHHSNCKTVEDIEALELCLALCTSTLYVFQFLMTYFRDNYSN